jgi:hypothetical protein
MAVARPKPIVAKYVFPKSRKYEFLMARMAAAVIDVLIP